MYCGGTNDGNWNDLAQVSAITMHTTGMSETSMNSKENGTKRTNIHMNFGIRWPNDTDSMEFIVHVHFMQSDIKHTFSVTQGINAPSLSPHLFVFYSFTLHNIIMNVLYACMCTRGMQMPDCTGVRIGSNCGNSIRELERMGKWYQFFYAPFFMRFIVWQFFLPSSFSNSKWRDSWNS